MLDFQRICWVEFFVRHFFSKVSDVGRNVFRFNQKKIFDRVVKTALYVSRGTIWEKVFFGKTMFFDLHQTLSRSCSTFLENFLNRDVKTAIYVSRGSFEKVLWKKKQCFQSYSDTERKRSGLLSKIFQPLDQNFSLIVQRNFLRKKFFWDIKRNYFGPLVNVFGGAAKTAFHMSKKAIWEKIFFRRKYVYF